MSFSICNDCGWSPETLVIAACVAIVVGIALGVVRHLLRG
jgi:hypothetical protein